jgi:quercetin dioxygenase-like cupin family protein
MDQQPHEPSAAPMPEGKSRVIAQTPGLRVVEYVLQPGEMLPWHRHSEVTDRFFCLEGVIGVEFRTPARNLLLNPGESCSVAPGIVHRSGNAAAGVSRYLLVQGVGRYDFIAVG